MTAVQRPSEIQPRHLARKAVVYQRVSSAQQVRDHKGSIEYQRSQSRFAEIWGWPVTAIQHVDEDLGRSATSSDGRTGYLRLAAEIRSGLVGIVLTSDVSRVGRQAIESFMLINDCAASDTLLALDGRVYDVKESGHLLLVRLVALLAEHDNSIRAEHSRRGRLGKLSKGISVSMAPTGYVRDKETGRFRSSEATGWVPRRRRPKRDRERAERDGSQNPQGRLWSYSAVYQAIRGKTRRRQHTALLGEDERIPSALSEAASK